MYEWRKLSKVSRILIVGIGFLIGVVIGFMYVYLSN